MYETDTDLMTELEETPTVNVVLLKTKPVT